MDEIKSLLNVVYTKQLNSYKSDFKKPKDLDDLQKNIKIFDKHFNLLQENLLKKANDYLAKNGDHDQLEIQELIKQKIIDFSKKIQSPYN